jgi:DNA-binding transcriptional ArsR family regulator
MVEFVKNGKIFEAAKLTEKELKALNSKTRIKILKKLGKKPSYPAKIAKELNQTKQKIYYHFEKLQEAELIQEDHKEEKSGGEATYYKPTKKGYVLDLGGKGQSFPTPERNKQTRKFLKPLIEDSEINGYVVPGSPEQHGPDQVQALDGHLTGEICFKLGNYSKKQKPIVKLDTEIVNENLFDQNLVILGGILTNVVTKKFNENFPVSFPEEDFPYRKLETPRSSFSDGEIGIITKTSNPEDRSKKIFLIAGIQNKGTKAAVKAFQDLEQILEEYSAGQFYTVVRGLDLNSDGEIDDYKVIETGG